MFFTFDQHRLKECVSLTFTFEKIRVNLACFCSEVVRSMYLLLFFTPREAHSRINHCVARSRFLGASCISIWRTFNVISTLILRYTLPPPITSFPCFGQILIKSICATKSPRTWCVEKLEFSGHSLCFAFSSQSGCENGFKGHYIRRQEPNRWALNVVSSSKSCRNRVGLRLNVVSTSILRQRWASRNEISCSYVEKTSRISTSSTRHIFVIISTSKFRILST